MKERGKIMTEEQKTEGCSESACSSCSQAGSCSSKKVDLHEPANAHSSIGKVIGVVSGKGGVGKSLVTGSLARQMVKMGYKVGILDADITGPSIPKMYGIHEKAQGTQEGILPRIAKDGTKIMSVNLLLEDEEAPVIWRGPVIAGVVKQLQAMEAEGYGTCPVCIAKTQYSFSDNAKLLGAPKGFTLAIRAVRLSAGAGFVVAFAGDIIAMPGLPKLPAAEQIDVDEDGKIVGLF